MKTHIIVIAELSTSSPIEAFNAPYSTKSTLQFINADISSSIQSILKIVKHLSGLIKNSTSLLTLVLPWRLNQILLRV